MPGEITLKEGLYELGREEPADVIVPVPTVSTRHAMLRVGASDWPSDYLTWVANAVHPCPDHLLKKVLVCVNLVLWLLGNVCRGCGCADSEVSVLPCRTGEQGDCYRLGLHQRCVALPACWDL